MPVLLASVSYMRLNFTPVYIASMRSQATAMSILLLYVCVCTSQCKFSRHLGNSTIRYSHIRRYTSILCMKDNVRMRVRILKRYERCYAVIINAFCNFCEIHAKQTSMKVCGHILGVALLILQIAASVLFH